MRSGADENTAMWIWAEEPRSRGAELKHTADHHTPVSDDDQSFTPFPSLLNLYLKI